MKPDESAGYAALLLRLSLGAIFLAHNVVLKVSLRRGFAALRSGSPRAT
jgi:hypothetical protein